MVSSWSPFPIEDEEEVPEYEDEVPEDGEEMAEDEEEVPKDAGRLAGLARERSKPVNSPGLELGP